MDSESSWGSSSKLRLFREFLVVIVQGVFLALLVRCFLFQPFNIPSGSMKSTLLVGDYLFVSKYSYGYSRYSFPFGLDLFSGRIWSAEPERGHVVVFKSARGGKDYIKRVIGLPGDRIRISDGTVHINDVAIHRESAAPFQDSEGRLIARYKETLPNGLSYFVLDAIPQNKRQYTDNTGEYLVPEGHYFMMGDNRDHSLDSRAPLWDGGLGFIPVDNLIGRAGYLFFSVDSLENPWKIWESAQAVRWKRLLTLVR